MLGRSGECAGRTGDRAYPLLEEAEAVEPRRAGELLDAAVFHCESPEMLSCGCREVDASVSGLGTRALAADCPDMPAGRRRRQDRCPRTRRIGAAMLDEMEVMVHTTVLVCP